MVAPATICISGHLRGLILIPTRCAMALKKPPGFAACASVSFVAAKPRPQPWNPAPSPVWRTELPSLSACPHAQRGRADPASGDHSRPIHLTYSVPGSMTSLKRAAVRLWNANAGQRWWSVWTKAVHESLTAQTTSAPKGGCGRSNTY